MRVVTGEKSTLTADSLTHRIRPLPGGMIIGPSRCTFAFNVNLGGVRGLLTASHCTKQFASIVPFDTLTNALFVTHRLGIETTDPAPWQTTTDCLTFRAYYASGVCRYADAAFTDYRFVARDSVDFGFIARTTFRGPGVGIVGSKQIDATNRHFEILGKFYSPPTGIYVDRVGVASGWTFHNISHACTTEYYHGAYHAKLWCQYRTGGGTNGGDSGAPFVYVYPNCTGSSGPTCVSAIGIHWGLSGDGRSIFSPISGIESDLGTIGVLVSDNPWP